MTTPPPTIPVPDFQVWWVIVGVVFAIVAAVGVAAILLVVAMWRKKRKRKKVSDHYHKALREMTNLLGGSIRN